jgi:hypothetical protein
MFNYKKLEKIIYGMKKVRYVFKKPWHNYQSLPPLLLLFNINVLYNIGPCSKQFFQALMFYITKNTPC